MKKELRLFGSVTVRSWLVRSEAYTNLAGCTRAELDA